MLVGDVVLGLASSGLHSNGFSLVRKILASNRIDFATACPWDKRRTWGDELLVPTRIYVQNLLSVMRADEIKGAAHITGGGLTENINRILPDHLAVEINAENWIVPEIFRWLALAGPVSCGEMALTFNCGMGMVLICGHTEAQTVAEVLKAAGETVFAVGRVVDRTQGSDQVIIDGLESAFMCDPGSKVVANGVPPKVPTAVLLSGSGSNLQTLIDPTTDPSNGSAAELTLVISNNPDAYGLTRARNAGIPTLVINHKDKDRYPNRESYDAALDAALTEHGIQMICLAGFMRILTAKFVTKWFGQMINLHPSLLPSFKGAHGVRDALHAGVRITGCTVHFVAPEVDSGAIILQEAVKIELWDTEDSLLDRIHAAEYRILPRALDLVTSKQAVLDKDKNLVIWDPKAKI